jgi:hypothetical protein
MASAELFFSLYTDRQQFTRCCLGMFKQWKQNDGVSAGKKTPRKLSVLGPSTHGFMMNPPGDPSPSSHKTSRISVDLL